MTPYNPARDTAVILCPTIDQEHHPEAVHGNCDGCAIAIWISPIAHDFKQHQKVPSMCYDCAQDYITRDVEAEETR